MKLSLSGKTSLAGSILQKSPAGFVPTHSESGAAVSAWARNGHCSSESQGQVLQLRAAVAVLLVLIKGSGCEFSVRDNKHPSLTHRWPGSAFCKSRFPQPGFLQIRSLRIFSQGKQFLIFRSKPHLKDSFFFSKPEISYSTLSLYLQPPTPTFWLGWGFFVLLCSFSVLD